MHSHDMGFRESLDIRATDANASILRASQLSCCAAESRARANRKSHWRLLFTLLLACSVPQLMLTGCTSGTVQGGSSSAASSGALGVSPASVTFGSVVVGQVASTNVALVNSSSAAVEVTSVTVSGQPFSVAGAANLPINVAAGATYNLSVSFSASAVGTTTGQLTIATNSSRAGTLAVSLTGTGSAASNAALSGLSCASSSFTGPTTATCGVTMSAAAGSGGIAVALTSDNNAVAVPSAVTVAAGSTSANFTATVNAVGTAQTAILTASAGGVSQSVALQLGASAGALSASASSLVFGNVNVNTTTSQQVTLTSSGNAPVTINSVTAMGTGFSVSGASAPRTLNPNQSLTLNVQFSPASTGAVTGQIVITSDAASGGTTTISLSGTGTILILPVLSSLSCTSSSLTGSATDACTVALNGPAPTGGISVNLQSSSGAVSIPAAVQVAAGASSAPFTATATPVSSAQTVTLTASTANSTLTFALQLGASPTTLSVNATSLAFGDVALNSPAAQSVTLSNSSLLPITVTLATVTGAGFSLVGATFPILLTAGQGATLAVQFDPTAAGSATGTLAIVSTSLTNPTTVVTLTGAGVASVSYQVNLTWDAPSSSADPVAGYNIYRSGDGGNTYEALNPLPLPLAPTAYSDVNVQNGQTYDYYIESVDSSGVASNPSNTATAAIP